MKFVYEKAARENLRSKLKTCDKREEISGVLKPRVNLLEGSGG